MEWLVVIGGIAVFLFFRYVKFGVKQAAPRASPPPLQARPASATIETQDTDEVALVGESKYLPAFELLFGPRQKAGVDEACEAVLVAEPENRFDKHAVRCEIRGQRVGYLSRDDAKSFSEVLHRRGVSSLPVTATVRGGWKNAKGSGHYGVTVGVPSAWLD